MSKRIIIVGKSASGKDYLRQKFIDRGFKPAISYTSRPIRENEVSGQNYHFITKEEFQNLILENVFYEYNMYNDWYYGLTKMDFYNAQIFIMTPKAISEINSEDRSNSFIIYLDTPHTIRFNRLKNRNMPGDNIERRMLADEYDFEDFIDYDLRITDTID